MSIIEKGEAGSRTDRAEFSRLAKEHNKTFVILRISAEFLGALAPIEPARFMPKCRRAPTCARLEATTPGSSKELRARS